MSRNQEVFPVYPPDYPLASKLALSILFSRKRSIRLDAANWIKTLKPPLMIQGKENIPLNGPLLLVTNHYYRPKYKVWWSVLASSALIPMDIHWVMTAAWTFPKSPMGSFLESISSLIFKRVADVYGFFSMPPMPPRAWETEARALAVHRILRYVKKNTNTAIGLAPEGGDSPSGTLEMPAPGTGRFLLHLAKSGLVIHPLGIYEAGGVLHLNFGKNLDLNSPSDTSLEVRDRWGSQVVMHAIAELLPKNLRGFF
jgi:hypothetical protein